MVDIETVVRKLESVPGDLATVERSIAQTKLTLDAAQEAIDDAELNAVLSANIDGSNDKARELQRKAAIAGSPEVKAARTALAKQQATLAGLEVDATQLRREFSAALTLAELEASRMRLMAATTTRQVHFNHNKERVA